MHEENHLGPLTPQKWQRYTKHSLFPQTKQILYFHLVWTDIFFCFQHHINIYNWHFEENFVLEHIYSQNCVSGQIDSPPSFLKQPRCLDSQMAIYECVNSILLNSNLHKMVVLSPLTGCWTQVWLYYKFESFIHIKSFQNYHEFYTLPGFFEYVKAKKK